MMFVERLREAWESRSSVVNPLHPRDPGIMRLFGLGSTTHAGVNVTPALAEQQSAVYACVRVLSSSIAALPLFVYERLERGKRRATEHPLFRLLHDAPNSEHDTFEFRRMAVRSLCLRGNFYAEKAFDRSGRIVALWPLHPDRVEPVRLESQRIAYRISLPSGEQASLDSANVLHVRWDFRSGLKGQSVIESAVQAVGKAIAADAYGARFFQNDASPRGALRSQGKLSEPARKNIRESWEQLHRGFENAHRTALLEEGLDWVSIGISNQDSQLLEIMKFNVEEIARFFGVQLHKIQSLDRATNNNIEHQGIEYVQDTLQAWVTAIEKKCTQQLLTERERERLFVEHDLNGLLRGDTAARGQFYQQLFQVGALSPNDILELENRNPVDGGDRRFVPLNMVPLDRVDDLDADSEDEPPPSAEPEQRSRVLRLEIRARRSADMRRRLAHNAERLFSDAGARIVRAEARDVGAAARKLLATRDAATFADWLKAHYQDPETQSYMRRTMAPVFETYAANVLEALSLELGDAVRQIDLSAFLAKVLEKFAIRHADSSAGQLQALTKKALIDQSDPLPLVEQRLAEWVERRPGKIGKRESVKASGAVSREAYMRSGVTRLRWVTFGDTCPFCEKFDGKIVGIEQTFAQHSDGLLEADGRAPMRVRGKVFHPPLHGTCDCQVVAA